MFMIHNIRPTRRPPPRSINGGSADTVSSSLDSTQVVVCTCKSALSDWWEAQGCQWLVDQCSKSPDLDCRLTPLQQTAAMRRTPLQPACLRSVCPRVIKALLNANPFSSLERDDMGCYPIRMVFSAHQYTDPEELDDVVEALLAVSPYQFASACKYSGSNTLGIACKLPMINTSVIARLLRANPACAAHVDSNDCWTPHHIYVYNGEHHDLEGARCIIDAYPDALGAVDDCGMTPLHLAAFRHFPETTCFC